MKVLDTTVAIDHLRGVVAASTLLQTISGGGERVIASELTRFELVAGVRPDEVDPLDDFLASIDLIPVTDEIARVGGELAREYRPSHGAIDDVDFLIAGTALVLDADLLTTNIRHFPMFEALAAPYPA